MAEAAFHNDYPAPTARDTIPSGPPTPVSWLMGLTTCALTAGVIYWGVQLAQRDPNSLPVISAPEGLARLEPTHPGGFQEEYTGLAVNKIQSGEVSEETVIALAPQPDVLEAEDVPALVDLEAEELAPARVDIQELDGEEQVQQAAAVPASITDAETGAEITMPVTAEEVELALAEALQLATEMMEERTGETPVEETSAEEAPATDVAEEEIDIAGLIVADVISQLAEPNEDEKAAEAEEANVEEQPTVEVTETVEDALDVAEQAKASTGGVVGGQEVASVETGTRLIQLGAFASRDIARTMWQTLQSRNSDLLAGRSYFIQPVESGGKTLFRLRVLGFENTDEARAMCTALTERKTPCLAVIQR